MCVALNTRRGELLINSAAAGEHKQSTYIKDVSICKSFQLVQNRVLCQRCVLCVIRVYCIGHFVGDIIIFLGHWSQELLPSLTPFKCCTVIFLHT